MPSWGQRTWALACCILLGVASADHETSTTGALDDWKSQCSTQGSPTKIKVQVRVRGPAAEELQAATAGERMPDRLRTLVLAGLRSHTDGAVWQC